MELRQPDPPLADDRIALRQWTDEDVSAIVAACRDPETSRWTTVPIPYTERDARDWLERCADGWERGIAPFAVVERDSGGLAAAISMWLQGPVAELAGRDTFPERSGSSLAGVSTSWVSCASSWARSLGIERRNGWPKSAASLAKVSFVPGPTSAATVGT
jgi:Acetyltransferase (GNAT) domain